MRLDAPYRGPVGAAGRPAALAGVPDALPLVAAGRVRKRWRYVGVFGPEVSACFGLVRVGPLTQSFWAVLDRRSGRLHERTRPRRAGVRLTPGAVRVRDGAVGVDLRLDESAVDAVETVTPYGPAFAWTVKRGGVPVEGTVRLGDREVAVDGHAVIDDSAGFPPRRTSWRWSAGVGTDDRGRAVAWNLVDGLHDDADASERSLWIDGRAGPLPAVDFATDLSSVSSSRAGVGHPGDGAPAVDLAFVPEATRARRENLLVVRSSYEQPFGRFTGGFGDVRLAEASGVMERHDAVW